MYDASTIRDICPPARFSLEQQTVDKIPYLDMTVMPLLLVLAASTHNHASVSTTVGDHVGIPSVVLF